MTSIDTLINTHICALIVHEYVLATGVYFDQFPRKRVSLSDWQRIERARTPFIRRVAMDWKESIKRYEKI